MYRNQDNDIDIDELLDEGGMVSATVAATAFSVRTAVVTELCSELEIPRLNGDGAFVIDRTSFDALADALNDDDAEAADDAAEPEEGDLADEDLEYPEDEDE